MRRTGFIVCILMLCGVLMGTAAAAQEPYALTRGNICMLLVEELELTDYDTDGLENPYSDLIPEAEYYDAVLICSELGIVSGYSNGSYLPRNKMTTAEAAAVICRAMGADPGTSNVVDWGAANGIFTENVGGTYDIAYSDWFRFSLISPYEIIEGDIWLDLCNGPLSVYVNEDCTAVIQNGTTVRYTGGLTVQQSDTAATGHTISAVKGEVDLTLAGVNICAEGASAVCVGSGAHLVLTLAGENTLTAAGEYGAGVHVPEGAQLTVRGSGALTATGGGHGAGIGSGNYWEGTGTIAIHAGTVTAIGNRGAGIGGGDGCPGGALAISGGTITATSDSGAGIGGGYGCDGGSIAISGGMVTASSGFGAGIGGGYEGDGGTLSVTDGIVSATGGINAAGIGGGDGGNGGTVTITGGVVTAKGAGGSGIGGGFGQTGGGVVTISDAIVTAGGAYYAIGGGHPDNRYGCDSITITNAVLELSYEHADGAECQERIFDSELPADVAALPGSSLTLATQAWGNSDLGYSWWYSEDQKDWKDAIYIGVNDQQAAMAAPMTQELAGIYLRCQLINGFGNVVYTNPVEVHVLAFERQPEPVEVNVNDTVTLSAAAVCDNVNYSWERSYDNGLNWNPVAGEIYSTLLFTAAMSENGALYRCVITAGNADRLASDAVLISVYTDDIVYTVKYYHQTADGSGYAAAEQSVLHGAAGVAVTAPTRLYDGFAENTSMGVHTGTVAGDGSLVLSRYYDRKVYAITLDTRGGSALPSINARYGAVVAAPSEPTRYGHDFGGWYADEQLTTPYTFTTMPLNGVTLYAKWVDKQTDRGMEYRINAILFRDSDSYELLDTVPDGDFLAEVSVTNLSSTQMDTVLFVSYTPDGRMLGFHYAYANPDIGQTMTFGTLIENKDGLVGKVKVMVLSSLAGAQPLAESVEK